MRARPPCQTPVTFSFPDHKKVAIATLVGDTCGRGGLCASLEVAQGSFNGA